MLTSLILIGALCLFATALFYNGWRKQSGSIKRMNRTMWDSQVQGWVAEGIRRGYVKNAGTHVAYDGRTKVQTLVVQTTAVKRLTVGEESEVP